MTTLLDTDKFVMGYSVLFMCTILKIVVIGISIFDYGIVLFGIYVFRRRYLMVCRINDTCYIINEGFSKIRYVS